MAVAAQGGADAVSQFAGSHSGIMRQSSASTKDSRAWSLGNRSSKTEHQNGKFPREKTLIR